MQKSALGKTNKYSGVVKSVKDNTAPEEPRITQEQVVSAFESFGFTPNERNHNDTAYWTTKGKSELPKLIEELHSRRMEINKQEDDQTKEEYKRQTEDKKREDDKKRSEEDFLNEHENSKKALPRLSDQDINALFDEYGLPAPDPEWARAHLPNDPKKIRSILEMQRKMADDMLKKHSKNSVNSMPEVPKPGSMPSGGGMGGYYGRGGPEMSGGAPSPMDIQGGMVEGDTPPTPFFIGDSAVVRIINPTNPNASTLWLVDPKKKVLQPFISEEAFQNAFENPADAEKSIITISSKELGAGGALEGFTPLKGDQGVSSDGAIGDVEFSPSQLQNRYGQQQNPDAESKSLSMLDGVLSGINNQPTQEVQ